MSDSSAELGSRVNEIRKPLSEKTFNCNNSLQPGYTKDSTTKMSEETPSSPPLARGAYQINWDEIDEFSDPFGSKPKMSSGVVGGSKLASSPPLPTAGKMMMPRTPPASPKLNRSSKTDSPKLKKTVKNDSNAAAGDAGLDKTIILDKSTSESRDSEIEFNMNASPANDTIATEQPADQTISLNNSINETPANTTINLNSSTNQVAEDLDASVNKTIEIEQSANKTIDLNDSTNQKADTSDILDSHQHTLNTTFEVKDTSQSKPPEDLKTDASSDPPQVAPSSPPLARGAYQINWDEIDEFSDPFGSKPKLPKKVAAPTRDSPDTISAESFTSAVSEPPAPELPAPKIPSPDLPAPELPAPDLPAPDTFNTTQPIEPPSEPEQPIKSEPEQPIKYEPVQPVKAGPVSPIDNEHEIEQPIESHPPEDQPIKTQPPLDYSLKTEPSTNPSISETDGVNSSKEREDEFRPANPMMLNTTADWDVLTQYANNPEAIQSLNQTALGNSSVLLNFDPLKKTRMTPPSKSNISTSNTNRTPIVPKTPGKLVDILDATIHETPVKRITDEEIEQRISERVEEALKQRTLQLEGEYNQKVNDRYKKIEQEVEEKVKIRLTKTDDQTRCAEIKARYVKLLESKVRLFQTHVEFITQPNSDNTGELKQIADELGRESSALKDYIRRCEVLRQDMGKLRKSEDTAKRQAKQVLHELSSSHQKFEEVKMESQNKLSVLYKQMKDMKVHHEAEKDKYELSVKKFELALKSLQQQLDHKNAENSELTKICDDLLQMGGKK